MADPRGARISAGDSGIDNLVGSVNRSVALLDQAEAKRVAARNRIALSSARSRWQAAETTLLSALQGDDNYSTFESRYNETMQGVTKDISETLAPDIQEEFRAGLHDDYAAGLKSVTDLARSKERVSGRSYIQSLVDINRKTYLSEQNPDKRKKILLETSMAIAAARDAQYYNPEEAGKLARETAKDYAKSWLSMQSSDEQKKLLTKEPTFDVGIVPLDDRATLLKSADKDILARRKEARVEADRQDRLAAKRINEEADQALKDFYSKPNPTMADVEALRRNSGIKPAEYKSALKAVAEDGADEDNADFIATVMPRLADEDLTRDLTRGLETGKLKTETYRTLVNQNRAALKDSRPDSPYRSGRNFLSVALDPGQLGGDGTVRQPLAIARASALADYDAFAEANPQMSRQGSMEKARELMEQYQNVAFDRMTLALPRPRGFFGSKREVTVDIVNAARQNLRDRIRAGELSGSEAAREIQSLDLWESVLNRQQVRK